MNANNNVDLAGSCILTSTEYAKALGVSEKKWIYPRGGAGIQDSDFCMHFLAWGNPQHTANLNVHSVWERPNYYSSPSLSRSLDACLEVSGLKKEDIDLFDFYSYAGSIQNAGLLGY